MNSRERVLAAIRHEIPDRVPVEAICVESGDKIAALLRIDPKQVLHALGTDGRGLGLGYAGEIRPPEGNTKFTQWGTPNTGDYGTARLYPLSLDSTTNDIEKYPWPDASRYDYAGAATAAKTIGDTYAVRGPYWHPLFCRASDLIGLENALIAMHQEPRVFEAVLEHVFAHTADLCQRFLDACGDSVPIFCLGDDFATQRGLMMNPGLWRRFLKPRYARLFEIGKSRGKFMWFHSCGDVTSVLPDLIDIGMDVWETVQLHTLPMTPAELKRTYGHHITFFGGINTQRLPFASAEEIRDEVQRCIRALGRNGGYVCGPDHHVKPDVPAENTVALFDAARAFRAPGYTLAT